MSQATPIDGAGKGYIRLYRSLLEHPLFKNKPAGWLKIWIYILLRVNWRESTFRPRQGESIMVPAGSMITSLEKLGTHAGLSKEHARRCLDYMERTHTVALERTHHYTVITVMNWATYQQIDDDAHHADHHGNHHSEVEHATHETPQQSPRATTPSKEVKNLNKKYTSNSDELDTLATNVQPKSEQRSQRKRSEVNPAVREWFDAEFWPIYPRHEGKSKALESANAKATTQDRRAFYLARLKAQLPEYDRRKLESGQRVIPMASTWFNQDRADDELATGVATGGRRHSSASQSDYPEYVPFTRNAG